MPQSPNDWEPIKAKLSKLNRSQLIEITCREQSHSTNHIVASVLISEMDSSSERRRFHLIFWPSLVAAIAAILSLVFQDSQHQASTSTGQQTAIMKQSLPSQMPPKNPASP
jgi:hypothetical protein